MKRIQEGSTSKEGKEEDDEKKRIREAVVSNFIAFGVIVLIIRISRCLYSLFKLNLRDRIILQLLASADVSHENRSECHFKIQCKHPRCIPKCIFFLTPSY